MSTVTGAVREGGNEIGRVAKENAKGRGCLPSAAGGFNRHVEIAVREVFERVHDVGIGFSEVDEARSARATADEHEDQRIRRHKQIVELVNSFSEELNEARQNVEVEIVNVLRRLGVKSSSDDAVTVTSNGKVPEADSSQTIDIPYLTL